MSNDWKRDMFEEAVANGFSNPLYKGEYEFYFHVLAQCKVSMTSDIELAGVNFQGTKYCLYINPENFDILPLNERLGILKHEMLHILFNHMDRKGKREHKPFNIAADAAINQLIKDSDLPEGCITPKSLEKTLKKEGFDIKIPKNENAETYYDLLPFDPDAKDGDEGKDCEDSGDSDGEGSGKPGKSGDPEEFYEGLWNDNPLDNHEKWDESEGDEDLKKDITKNMIEKAAEKSRGNAPSELGIFLDIWTRKPVVSWKKVLRNIASNKKANKVSTIMKKSRRFPKRPDIKGSRKDRTWDLMCIIDTSGSVSNEEIYMGLSEINEVCKIMDSNMKVLQVDTECSEIEEYDPNKKTFERKHCGGTYIAAGVEYLYDNNINSDAIIVISDMYIENITTDEWWLKYKKPVIFLSTSGHIPEVNKNHRIFNLKDA